MSPDVLLTGYCSVGLPMSIIVGCLPTLRPLYEKVEERSSSRKGSTPLRDESYGLRSRSADKIHKTTMFSVDYHDPGKHGYIMSEDDMERGKTMRYSRHLA